MARLDLSVDPKREFERKRMEAHQATLLVESGDLVWIPSSHQPPAILATLAAREEELIAVAHPDHRDWLRDEARRLYYP